MEEEQNDVANDSSDAEDKQRDFILAFVVAYTDLEEASLESYRDYVLQNELFIDVRELTKSSGKAHDLRQIANHLYLARNYKAALEMYNLSICYAPENSATIGCGYANRSAIYFEQGEYELALANIALAMKNNYPERLKPKLELRAQSCKDKISSRAEKLEPFLQLNISSDVYPKIPFLVNGIRMERLTDYGRSMIAERDFSVGSIILEEKPLLTCISPKLRYQNCSYCSSAKFGSLIPCSRCPSAMYCGQDCLEKAWKHFHRFECEVSEKFQCISYGNLEIGARMFFYGLGLFNDNVEEMMEFCTSSSSGEDDPLKLNYVHHDPLEEFKMFHRLELPAETTKYECLFRFYAAVCCAILKDHPLLNSLFVSDAQKNFMLEYILRCVRAAYFLSISNWERGPNELFSVASICNHSCVPNTLALRHFGKLKLVVMRPIASGEQILISYGPLFKEDCTPPRKQCKELFSFDCKCEACDHEKLDTRLEALKANPVFAKRDANVILTVLYNADQDWTTRQRMLESIIERYATTHPRNDFINLLDKYRDLLTIEFEIAEETVIRAEAVRY